MISERKARILYLFLCTFGKNFLCLASIRSRPFFSLHCITSAFIKSHRQQIQSPVHGKPFKATLCSSASGVGFCLLHHQIGFSYPCLSDPAAFQRPRSIALLSPASLSETRAAMPLAMSQRAYLRQVSLICLHAWDASL